MAAAAALSISPAAGNRAVLLARGQQKAAPQTVEFNSSPPPISKLEQKQQDWQRQLGHVLGNIRENVIKLLPKQSEHSQGSLQQFTMAAIDEQKEKGLTMLRQLSDSVQDKVQRLLKDSQDYAQLVVRYQQWFDKHRALESKSADANLVTPALDIVKEEYAKLDQELMREKCAGHTDQENVNENLDFVFELLNKLTSRLEARLELEAEQVNSDAAELGELAATLESNRKAARVDEQQVTNALERIKRICLKTAAQTMIEEAPRLIKLGLVHAAGAHFAMHPAVAASPLWAVEHIVQIMGGSSVPVAVMYLRDIQIRTAMMTLEAIIPLDEISCQLKKNLSAPGQKLFDRIQRG